MVYDIRQGFRLGGTGIPLGGPVRGGQLQPAPSIFPTAAAMPAPPQRPSFLSRLLGGPAAGMLSPDQQQAEIFPALLQAGLAIGASKGNTFQALLEGLQTGRGAYMNAIETDQTVQAAQKKMQLEQQRRAIMSKYPAQPNETPQQVLGRLQRMLPEFIGLQDIEMVKYIVELLKSQGDQANKPVPLGPDQRLVDPATGREIAGATGGKRVVRTSDLGDRMREYYSDGTSQDVPKGRSPGGDSIEAQRTFQRGAQLSDDYRSWVTPWMNGKQAIERAVQYRNEALNGNGPAQIQFLYAFISTLDNSVVREGEVRLMQEGAAVVDAAKRHVQRWSGEGAALPPELARQMADILDRVQGDLSERFNLMRKSYIETGKAWGVGEEFFPDINRLFPGSKANKKPGMNDALKDYPPRK